MIKDKIIITLTAKYPLFEGILIDEAVIQIKEGIEEICGELFKVEVNKDA